MTLYLYETVTNGETSLYEECFHISITHYE